MRSQVMEFVNKVMEEQRAKAMEGTAADPNEVPDEQLKVGELLNPERLDGETNEEYAERRKFSKRYTKYVKQGRKVWDSATQGTYTKKTA